MKTYDELKALIEQRGVHPEFGDAGEGWGIEQSPHELATFLVRMQELGVTSCLEIGTGYKGGLSRFLAADMGWDVTTVDIKNYGHAFEGVHYVILPSDTAEYNPGRTFDLVFIDGNHTHDSVKRDFYNHSRWAKHVTAFHDIQGLRDCQGVQEFWSNLFRINGSLIRGAHEIIADQNPSGIGYVMESWNDVLKAENDPTN